jgi:serine acetyltransferase
MKLILTLFKSIFLTVLNSLFSIQNRLRLFFIKIRFDLVIEKRVSICSLSHFIVGRNVYISEGAILNCGGAKWCDYKGGIKIGKDSHIGYHCILLGGGGIEIGDKVLIAPGTVISSQGHFFKEIDKFIKDQGTYFAKVSIGDDVWIGANATILPGVSIGKGSVIGAGCVVNKNIPPYSVAVGIPAKVIHERRDN